MDQLPGALHGLYPEQIERWRLACEQANDSVPAREAGLQRLPRGLGGRGRLTGDPDRRIILALVDEAVAAVARPHRCGFGSTRHFRLRESADGAARGVRQESKLHRVLGIRVASILQGLVALTLNALRKVALTTNAD